MIISIFRITNILQEKYTKKKTLVFFTKADITSIIFEDFYIKYISIPEKYEKRYSRHHNNFN